MCMEDVKLGRSKTSASKVIACLNGTNTQIVAADPYRTALIVGPANNQPYILAPEGMDATQTQGFLISTFDAPVVIDIERYGLCVVGKWFAMAFTGAATVQLTVMEVGYNSLKAPK